MNLNNKKPNYVIAGENVDKSKCSQHGNRFSKGKSNLRNKKKQ